MDDFSLNLDNVTENMFDHFKVNLWQNVLFYKCTYFSFVQNTIMNRMDQYWQIGCVIHFGNCCQALVKVKKGGYIRYIVEIFITSKLVATIYRSLSLKLVILTFVALDTYSRKSLLTLIIVSVYNFKRDLAVSVPAHCKATTRGEIHSLFNFIVFPSRPPWEQWGKISSLTFYSSETKKAASCLISENNVHKNIEWH